jgi:hypothetical protein
MSLPHYSNRQLRPGRMAGVRLAHYSEIPYQVHLVLLLQRPLLTSLKCSVIFSYTLQLSIHTVAFAIAGRAGPDELSVAGFSLMLAFVTG